MQYRVIARQKLLLRDAEAGQYLGKFLVGNVGLVVQNGPVIDNQDILFRHGLRAAQGQLLLVELVADHKILKLQHGHAARKGAQAEAGDQLRSGLGDGDDPPAVLLLELLQDAADQGGLAGSRSAGQNNAGDFLGHMYRSHAFLFNNIISSGFFQ